MSLSYFWIYDGKRKSLTPVRNSVCGSKKTRSGALTASSGCLAADLETLTRCSRSQRSHDCADGPVGPGSSHLCFLFAFPHRPHKSVTRSHTLFKNINASYAKARLHPAGQCPALCGCCSRETFAGQRNIHLQEGKSLPDNLLLPFNEGLHNGVPSVLMQIKSGRAASARLLLMERRRRRRHSPGCIDVSRRRVHHFPPGTFHVALILSPL